MPNSRIHVYIRGRVQGVCFRMYTQQQAGLSGVTGWVRNMHDGRVEAVFEGEQSSVERMVAWCHEGPSYASVESVETVAEEYRGEFDGFSITY